MKFPGKFLVMQDCIVVRALPLVRQHRLVFVAILDFTVIRKSIYILKYLLFKIGTFFGSKEKSEVAGFFVFSQ